MRDYPLDSEAIKNLSDYFSSARGEGRTVWLSFDRLLEIANPTSLGSLSRIVQDLVAGQMLAQVYRVEYGSGITSRSYKTLTEIPEVLYDRDGIEVIPNVVNTKAYYLFCGENASV